MNKEIIPFPTPLDIQAENNMRRDISTVLEIFDRKRVGYIVKWVCVDPQKIEEIVKSFPEESKTKFLSSRFIGHSTYRDFAWTYYLIQAKERNELTNLDDQKRKELQAFFYLRWENALHWKNSVSRNQHKVIAFTNKQKL